MNLCTDSLLFELVDDARIVSVTSLSRDPNLSPFAARAARLAVNHGAVEEVLAAAPDLVLTDQGSAAYASHLLERVGVEVLAVPIAARFVDYRETLERVAARLDATARAASLLARLDQALAQPAPSPPRSALVYQPNGFVQGTDSLMNDVLRHAGLENVAARIGLTHGGYLDLERVVLHAPDVLVFSRRSAAAPSLAEAQLDAPALRALFARREHPVRRAELDEALWTCPGSFNAEAVAQLREARP
ncbi:MAG: ABC transporter substrate-binding protein [Gammaproteobacteria bacterium]